MRPPVSKWADSSVAERFVRNEVTRVRFAARPPGQWPCSVEVSTALFHGADSGALPDKAAIRCLDSSIGRAADSRRLVSKENVSNGGGRAIRPAASIICGFRDHGPAEVPFKITV